MQDYSSLYYQNSRREMTLFLPPSMKTVLEIGCGDGVFAAQLKEAYGAEVWGIELDPQAATSAGEKLDRVYQGDALKILVDIPENYFDLVICNDVIEHVPDPESLITLIKSKLILDKGTLVCSIPNVRYIKNLYHLLVKADWNYTMEGGILDKGHLRFFTQKSIQQLFSESGYQVEKIEGINPTRLGFLFTMFNILTLGFFRDSRYMQFACILKT